MLRLFVAVEIPESIRERLAGMAGGIPGARWTSVENIHLTLRFIGEVTPPQANEIDDALARIEAPAFDLALAGIDRFGDRKPRSIWAGVEPNPALTALQHKIENALQHLGYPPDPRKFTPHVTIARLKNAPRDRIGSFLANHSLFRTEQFEVDHFTLFSSRLSHNGSQYAIERTYPLSLDLEAAAEG